MSVLGEAYVCAYRTLAGTVHRPRLWHYQWLAQKDLLADLADILPALAGRIADIGCGESPYRYLFDRPEVLEYAGIDIKEGPNTSIVIPTHGSWPIPDCRFDVIVCTQVLEHVGDQDAFLRECHRVLKPGGKLLLTLPFLYQAHGVPHDYRRLTVDGLERQLMGTYDAVTVRKQGAAGSTIGQLVLNWIDDSLSLTRVGLIIKGVTLPAWILVSLCVNAIGAVIDKIDHTGNYYSNVLFLGTKRE